MIELFALALIQSAPVAETVPPEQEIVVIGRKLKLWRGHWSSRDGRAVTCKTKKSSGDPEIDLIGCQALELCAAPAIPKLLELKAIKGLSRDERRSREAAIQAPVGSCMMREREAGITRLAERRAGAAAR